MERLKFCQGNEACAEGALYAGCNFFAGYPISPSSEIAEYLAYELPRRKGVFIEMEDEIASMGAVIGASLAGAKAMTATSGPGFSLKQEHIGYACIAEVPCVIVDVMRGGPSTGTPTGPAQGDVMQARWGTHGDHPAVAIAPSTVEECFYETVRAFNISERYRNPVILLIDEVVGHMRERIRIPKPGEIEIINRKKPTEAPEFYYPYKPSPDGVPTIADFGTGYRFHVTGLSHDPSGFPTNDPKKIGELIERLANKIEIGKEEITRWEGFMLEDAETVIVAYGSVARSAKSAVKRARNTGKKVGLLKLITIWPFPSEPLERLAGYVKRVIVPEMNLGQIALEVERVMGGKADVIRVNRVDTELISPDEIMAKL
ncbi:MAG TPA: 2-oxoacid:acceptor oxidoreductase subunit alpha [Thermodesulfobacteriota bacterium]|nr:2-oxoacid:acceptor oxidoreductase subunit alpha [Thermodesulfobacteriota bacterium]